MKKSIFLLELSILVLFASSCGVEPNYAVPAGQVADIENSYFNYLEIEEETETSEVTEEITETTEKPETTFNDEKEKIEELLNNPVYKTANEIISSGDWDNTKYVKTTDNGDVIKVIFVPDFENSKSKEELELVFEKIAEIVYDGEESEWEGHECGDFIGEVAFYYNESPFAVEGQITWFFDIFICTLHSDCFLAG